MRISLKVPRDQWIGLCISAFLNVSLWMAVMGYALVWLPASEAAVIAYTMPIWTALLAWPLLGERMTWLRAILALALAFAGLSALLGGNAMSRPILRNCPDILALLAGASASRSAPC